MKKLLYFLLTAIIFSCSRGSEPTYIYGPDPSYFEINENEVKVHDFQVKFSGEMQVDYVILQAEYDQEEKKGAVLKRGTLEVNGEEVLEILNGYKFLDMKISPGEGEFDIILNNEEPLVLNMNIRNFDSEFSFFIPYKY